MSRSDPLVATITRAFPDVIAAYEGRGRGRHLRVTWPDGVFTLIGPRRSHVHEWASGLTSTTDTGDRWRGRAGLARLVADLRLALERARAPGLFDAPPDPWNCGNHLGDCPIVDSDHVDFYVYTAGPETLPVWQVRQWAEERAGRRGHFSGTPRDVDCEGGPPDTGHRCGLFGPVYTPCTYADCDLELGGGCVLRGPPA